MQDAAKEIVKIIHDIGSGNSPLSAFRGASTNMSLLHELKSRSIELARAVNSGLSIKESAEALSGTVMMSHSTSILSDEELNKLLGLIRIIEKG